MEGVQLMRADSWELPGLGGCPQMLKTVSNAQEAPVCSPPAAQGMPGPAPSAKPVLVPAPSNDPSTTSTWTQQQQQQQPGVPPPCDGLAGGAGPPLGQQQQQAGGGSGGGLLMRQVSLDAITAADFCPAAAPAPDRSSIFNDVIEQLAAKEESLPAAAGLYTLPSIQFLESLLEDMDSKTASDGRNPVDPPLYLPLDAFDLPFEEPAKLPVRPLAPSPFDMAPAAGAPHPPPPPQQLQPTYHVHAAATLRQPIAPPHPHHHHHSGLIPTSNSMPVLGQPPLGYHGSSQFPVSRSAGPSPSKPVRRAASAYGAFEYEDASEMTLQASKSGRVRKVASFAGAKRKMSGDVAARASDAHLHALSNAVSESDTGATTLDDDSDEEVSKGSKASRKQKGKGGANKNKGGKRTTCLNCGCHQTPQWRCGPLGPRTLCNACGVRYKKGLPLNCWPIREGMVLPPGAVLPPGVHIPGVILQPALDDD